MSSFWPSQVDAYDLPLSLLHVNSFNEENLNITSSDVETTISVVIDGEIVELLPGIIIETFI